MKTKGLILCAGLVIAALAADAVGQAVRMSGGRRGGTGVRFAQTQDDDDHQTAAVGANSFVDPRDGKTYRIVRIGDRVWMAENLNHQTADSWCYDSDNANCAKYGRLYTWAAAQTACPAGWRLAGHDERRTDWVDLLTAAGGAFVNFVRDGEEHMAWENAGTKLKSRTGWDNNANGTDDFGFSALPGGFRDFYGNFNNLGVQGYWWNTAGRLLSGPVCADCALTYGMSPGNNVTMFDYPKNVALSVRCVRD